MLRKTAFRILPAAALLAAACTSPFASQTAAPVINGSTTGGVYTPTSTNTDSTVTNPYGEKPYTPDSATTQPYTPTQPAPTYTPAQSSGTYVGNYAPVDVNAATHHVVGGDTVYNISKRYGISQDNLRAWNNLPDNNIRLGQTLRVKPAGYVAPAAAASQTTVSTPAKTSVTPSSGTTSAAGITWQKPVAGSVSKGFGGDNKGLDITGTRGQPVAAAAAGKVVYSGSGLRGYGNLVIVQHNSNYLSAYGNNDTLLVKEGQQVSRGQQIATMGSKLHFEVRENGKPVNPTRFVPY